MKTFIQLKDNVGFAVVNTVGETDGIEVAYGTGEQYLGKLYLNGVWSNAENIWFAEIDYDGSILEIKKTVFSSEVGDRPVLNPNVSRVSKWINGAWVNPEEVQLNPVPETPTYIEPLPPVEPSPGPLTTSEPPAEA